MRPSWRILTIPLCLLMAVFMLSVTASAEPPEDPEPQTVVLQDDPEPPVTQWYYDSDHNVLVIDCPETLSAISDWNAFAVDVKTIVIMGDVETIAAKAFASFTNAKYVVVNAPWLDFIDPSAFKQCKKVTQVFFVGDEIVDADLANAVSSTAQKVFLDDIDQLCVIEFGEVEHGTFVTDAGQFAKKGSTVNLSVLPDPGYRCGSITGGEYVSPTVRRITGNTTFTASCSGYYKELMDENAWGSCGPQANWYLYEDGELFITGLGAMTSAIPSSYASAATTLTIDSGVTAIPANGFVGYINLTEIVVGEDVVSIGAGAFSGCAKLNKAVLGESVDSIGNSAFSGCTAMYQAEFMGDYPATRGKSLFPYSAVGRFIVLWHEGREGWADNDFTDASDNHYPTRCAEIEVTDFSTLEMVGDNLYRNGQGLYFILDEAGGTMTATVGTGTGANNSGYDGNNNGTAVIPDEVVYDGQAYAVRTIAKSAFSDNLFLRQVNLGANVQLVARGAFLNCPNFTEFTVDKNNTSFRELDGILYNYNMKMLRVVPGGAQFVTYEIPSVVQYIDTDAFYGCNSIEEVEINLGVERIFDYAFQNATGLRSVRINGSVKDIGTGAFSGCKNLQSVFIYDGVDSIGATPFAGCTSLRTLTLPFLGTSPNSGTKATFATMFGMDAKVVPAVNVTVAGGKLADNAFRNCVNLRSLRLISTADFTAIPKQCFDGCSNLLYLDLGLTDHDPTWGNAATAGEVILQDHITSIGNYAFRGCAKIAAFRVDKDNEAYASDYWGALYDKDFTTLICYPPSSSLPYYCLKGSALEAKDDAFYNCGNLLTLNIPNAKANPSNMFIYPSPFSGTSTAFPFHIYVHKGSPAETTLGKTRVYPIEDMAAEELAIQVYHISDKLAFEAGSAPEFENLYFTAIYSEPILLDESDYDLTISGTGAGTQTATATYHQKNSEGKDVKTTFNVLFVAPKEDHTILEYNLASGTASEKLHAMSGLYGFNGKMLDVSSAGIIDNVTTAKVLRAAAYVPTSLLDGAAEKMKVFLMEDFCPKTEPIQEQWLPAPTGLTWGVAYKENGTPIQRQAQISWDASDDGLCSYDLNVYRKGTGEGGEDELVYSTWRYSYGAAHVEDQNFLRRIDALGSGTYYFTVVAQDAAGIRHDSAPATSPDFVYVKPDTTLDPCANLTWGTDGLSMNWVLPEDTTYYGGYTFTMYFRRWTAGEWRSLGSSAAFFDKGECTLRADGSLYYELIDWFYARNNYRPGYYAFTLTTESADVTRANRSTESAMSGAYYYRGP